VRYGIAGNSIDFGKVKEVPMPLLAMELLAFVDDVLGELGIRREVEYVTVILENGTSVDRQLKTFHGTGDLEAVVDQLIDETREGWS
jgi:carboxylate-amine ligase